MLLALDRGQIDGEALYRRAQDELGWTGTYDELAIAWCAAFQPNRDLVALAAQVTASSVLLTDNGPPLRDRFSQILPTVRDVLDRLIFSADLGVTKADVATFARTCELLALAPSEVFFVDDSAGNVARAQAAGLVAYNFTTAPSCAQVLTELGLLPRSAKVSQ